MRLKKESYIRRCFDLARLGGQKVSPNPLVGAVIVYKDTIIGEGYHQVFGGAHAEINAINNVKESNQQFLHQSCLYLSLEPCSHYGKTPPCVDRILEKKIPKVVISYQDPNPKVAGKGVQKLRAAGVEVELGILQAEGKKLLAGFDFYHHKKRPKVILKFAQSKDGFLGKKEGPVWLTNPYSKRLVHKWRSEVDSILIGTNTAIIDNPNLDARFHFSPSPLRIVLDRQGKVDRKANVFNGKSPSLLVTEKEQFDSNLRAPKDLNILKLDFGEDLLPSLLSYLYEKKYQQLLVEGGGQLLHSFIAQNLWDEARVFKSPKCLLDGIPAPDMDQDLCIQKIQLLEDQLFVYKNPDSRRLE